VEGGRHPCVQVLVCIRLLAAWTCWCQADKQGRHAVRSYPNFSQTYDGKTPGRLMSRALSCGTLWRCTSIVPP